MADIAEIAPRVYRISVFVPEFNLQFNQFLVDDDEPLLFHTGLRAAFPPLREAVARLMDPARLRWIAFSHFESDECGALNHWLASAPNAEPACNIVSALVSVNDFSDRPARIFDESETLRTGKNAFRFIRTPHLPHGWDAGVLFEETNKTLFCSDLFHQSGHCDAVTEADIVSRTREALIEFQAGPFANYAPYTNYTGRLLNGLAELRPATLAVMHGASFRGDCRRALVDLASVFRDVLSP
jgi:flavorubredoxin